MSDFHQRGLISTLPRLTNRRLEDLEEQLEKLSGETPLALILPSTLEDLRRPALQEILREIASANYLTNVVVSVGQATRADLEKERARFPGDPRLVFLWCDDPALQTLQPGSGKGYNLWAAIGWLLLRAECQAVVAHDADILNYSRELPALLALPLLDRTLGYRFIKGYYPRMSEKAGGQLFGRVTRLFVGPLLRALVRVAGYHPLLNFLDSFRYPLAGEFGAFLEDLAGYSIPVGWGLEVEMLCSVHRSLEPESVAQIDLGANYEHKHQLSGQTGLTRLASEITASLLRQLAREGVSVTADFHLALRLAYTKTARDTLRRYRHVASLNHLSFDETEESSLIESFAQVLIPPPVSTMLPAFLPAWNEIRGTRPDFCASFAGWTNC